MLKKYALQCGAITLSLVSLIIYLSLFNDSAANYLINNHYYSDRTADYIGFHVIEDNAYLLLLLFITPSMVATALSAAIISMSFNVGFRYGGFEAHILPPLPTDRQRVNQTAKNVILLVRSTRWITYSVAALVGLSTFPLTPFFKINSLLLLTCSLIVSMGHICISRKYNKLLIRNTQDKTFAAKNIENRILGTINYALRLKDDTLFICKPDSKESIAWIDDERFYECQQYLEKPPTTKS